MKRKANPDLVSYQLPFIPEGTAVADPRDHNDGNFFSPLWALLFGPFYYLRHGFMREFFLTLVLAPVMLGFIVSPFLARSAWHRRAVDRADKVNLETLIRLCLENRDVN